MAMDNDQFQFRWANREYGVPNNENDYREISARIEGNKARIAQLKAELKKIEAKESGALTDMDLLDLDLAANRANAYDMANTTAALGRIDSRMANRVKTAQDNAREERLKRQEKELKRAEIEDKIRQAQVERSKAKLDSERAVYDSQLEYLGKQLEAEGGHYENIPYNGADAQKVLSDYFGKSVNTANGRKFNADVDADMKSKLVQDLLSIGEYEKAMELEKTLTEGEKKEAKAKTQAKRKMLKDKADAINKVIMDNQYKPASAQTDLLTQAISSRDSLARNYPDLFEIKNNVLHYKAKD